MNSAQRRKLRHLPPREPKDDPESRRVTSVRNGNATTVVQITVPHPVMSNNTYELMFGTRPPDAPPPRKKRGYGKPIRGPR